MGVANPWLGVFSPEVEAMGELNRRSVMKALLLSEGVLCKQPCLQDASTCFLNHLEEFATEMSFVKGQVLFREGEYADRFYLVLTGKIGLEWKCEGHSPYVIQVVQPGEVLGWSWLFPPFQWHFTARARQDGTALQFNAASLLIRAEQDPAFGYELMKRFGALAIDRLQLTRTRLLHKLQQKETASSTGARKRPVLTSCRPERRITTQPARAAAG